MSVPQQRGDDHRQRCGHKEYAGQQQDVSANDRVVHVSVHDSPSIVEIRNLVY